jgi:hypothetical protein
LRTVSCFQDRANTWVIEWCQNVLRRLLIGSYTAIDNVLRQNLDIINYVAHARRRIDAKCKR